LEAILQFKVQEYFNFQSVVPKLIARLEVLPIFQLLAQYVELLARYALQVGFYSPDFILALTLSPWAMP
jgi:hypothetical protein